jgi:dATP pyrophosphohydrolase
MPRIVSDIVDVYVFRHTRNQIQFLLLRRRPDVVLGDTWQSIHGKIEPGERAVEAAMREVEERTGFVPKKLYSADYINQFYDHASDTIVLAPAFAAMIDASNKLRVSQEYSDYAWCDLEETVARLPWSGQRWAVRHIYDVIGVGGDEADFYALT